jgi:hypothetical protein
MIGRAWRQPRRRATSASTATVVASSARATAGSHDRPTGAEGAADRWAPVAAANMRAPAARAWSSSWTGGRRRVGSRRGTAAVTGLGTFVALIFGLVRFAFVATCATVAPTSAPAATALRGAAAGVEPDAADADDASSATGSDGAGASSARAGGPGSAAGAGAAAAAAASALGGGAGAAGRAGRSVSGSTYPC